MVHQPKKSALAWLLIKVRKKSTGFQHPLMKNPTPSSTLMTLLTMSGVSSGANAPLSVDILRKIFKFFPQSQIVTK
jgi:hypothetical protein